MLPPIGSASLALRRYALRSVISAVYVKSYYQLSGDPQGSISEAY